MLCAFDSIGCLGCYNMADLSLHRILLRLPREDLTDQSSLLAAGWLSRCVLLQCIGQASGS